MLAFRDEALEIVLRFTDPVRPGHADNVKPMRARLFDERLLDRASP
jgi:hypothetical protein